MTYTKPYLAIVFALLLLAFKAGDKPVLTIAARYDYYTADNLGNVYFVKEDELLKHLANGKFFARYSNLKLGNITTVDVTNPLKLVLYYKDFQQVVFLDNQLSVNSEAVSLELLGHEQTELVCASANNSFWIYDKQNNELLRFNESSKKIAATGNLKQILQTELQPNFMMEHNGFLYLNCPETGIYVFDMFGAFSKIISVKGLNQFTVSENLLYYQKANELCSYDFKLFDEACKLIPVGQGVADIKYNNKSIYVGFRDSLQVKRLGD